MAMMQGLKRVAQVYALLEQMRSAEVRVATGAVHQVEQARQWEAEVAAGEEGAGRAALMLGLREDWAIAGARAEAARIRSGMLEQERTAREVVREDAMAAYRRSRLELQQTQSVVDRAQQQKEVEDARRTQAVADDRYLSRRDWTRAQKNDWSA